jgi:hypothetical protein
MPAVGRKPKTKSGSSTVQSYIFPKSKFTRAQAVAWLKKNKKFTGGIDETSASYRARQYDPKHFKRFRTMAIGKRGVRAIIGVVKAAK